MPVFPLLAVLVGSVGTALIARAMLRRWDNALVFMAGLSSILVAFLGFDLCERLIAPLTSPGQWLSFKLTTLALELGAVLSATFYTMRVILRFADTAMNKG